MNLFKRYLSVLIGICFLTIIFFHDRLRDYDEGRYHETPPESIIALNKIKFEEVSEEYGLGDAKHNLFFANKSAIIQKYVPFITVNAYMSAIDINQDGYMDLFFQETLPEKASRLFLNEKGKGFKDISDRLDVLGKKGKYGSSISAWADFNNDGKLDFFTADTPCYVLFLQTSNLKFEEVKNRPDFCSVPSTLNLLDFNRDGNLDIAISSYFPDKIIHERTSILHQLIGMTLRLSKNGESNAILLGDGKGEFEVLKSEDFTKEKGQTTSLGVAYINNDAWPDIFVGNDFSFDEMYLSEEGKDLKNVTDTYIPRFHHGFSGMNSDFADYDLDGDLDLFVTNGRARGRKAKSFDQAKSISFLRVQVRSIPSFFRERLFDLGDDQVPNLTESDFQFYGFERNCLFSQHEGKFYDVAQFAGVDDLENGRSIVSFDIENDGKIDVAISNTDGPLLLYKNVSETEGNWVGFSLENKFGLPYHGATIFAVRSDKKPLRKELFVGNGGRAISDPRIHFGLGDNDLDGSGIIVLWPDGKYEKFNNVRINQYNKLQYGHGSGV